MPDLAHRIRSAAYHLWERDSRPDGREAEHWRGAEQMIWSEMGTADASPVKQVLQTRRSAKKTADLKPAGGSNMSAAPTPKTAKVAGKARRKTS